MKLRFSMFTFLLLALAVPAIAAKPIIVVEPLSSGVLDTMAPCGFDMNLTPLHGHATYMYFANKQIITGAELISLTNLNTGKSINVSTGSQDTFTYTATNTIFTLNGPTVGTVSASDAAILGIPQVFALNGRLQFVYDDLGNVVSESFIGTAVDLCQALS